MGLVATCTDCICRCKSRYVPYDRSHDYSYMFHSRDTITNFDQIIVAKANIIFPSYNNQCFRTTFNSYKKVNYLYPV